MRYYLAIDIGASSGRHIAGWLENGEIRMKEVYRFPNWIDHEDGHLVWDTERIVREVKAGFDAAAQQLPGRIESFAIDTWGVDYVLMDGDRALTPCFAGRDGRTQATTPLVHGRMSFSDLYRRTGISCMPYNSIYQLYDDKLAGRLEHATDFMLLPEYLMFRLCGVKCHEYTNATTTGLVNAFTGQYDPEIIRAMGFPEHIFGKVEKPGIVIGEYKGAKAVLCATHDTSSAIEGIPLAGRQPYISSGTWSILGVKSEIPLTDPESERTNWSNEGGADCVCYQKTLMGMWMVNRLQEELCPEKSFPEIVEEARASAFDGIVDPNARDFLAPESMKAAFDGALREAPRTVGDYFRCAYRSLAFSYRDVFRELEANTGRTYEQLCIVGGGAKNTFLNELTQEAVGRKVLALPIEATSIGNLKTQMRACGEEDIR